MAAPPQMALDIVSDVAFSLAVTTQPWSLGIDAMVVSVGPSGFGQLGNTIQGLMSTRVGDRVDFAAILPGEPLWCPLDRGDAAALELQALVLASAHDRAALARGGRFGEAPATIDAAALAVTRALEVAAANRCQRVGTPLLGTGQLGFTMTDVAMALFPMLHEAAEAGRFQGLSEVTIFVPDPDTASALDKVWRIPGRAVPTEPGPSRPSPADETVPDEQAQSAEAESDQAPIEVATIESRLTADAVDPEVWRAELVAWSGLRLSDTATVVLARAAALIDPLDSIGLTADLLLFACLENAAATGYPDVAGRMLTELDAIGAGRNTVAELRRRLGVTSSAQAPSMPPNEVGGLREVIDASSRLAERLEGYRNVRQRHLLAIAISQLTVSPEFLAAIGEATSLRACLRSAVASARPHESPDVWSAVLAEPISRTDLDSLVLAGGMSADLVTPALGIDASEDHLGLGGYVDMFATLIAQTETPLPLSVGLFGEWGSGKSTFMGLLTKRIQELSGPSAADGYAENIKQISFNAWHYADTNLWASLGDEIFEQLAGPGPSPDAQREQLRIELAAKLERRKVLNQATTNAQAETAALKIKVDEARSDAAKSARTVLRGLAGSPTIRDNARKAWNRLGISDETEQAELLTSQIRRTGGDVNVLRLATSGPRGVILCAISAVALLLIALAAMLSSRTRDLLLHGGLVAVVGGWFAVGLWFVARVRSGVGLLSKVVVDVRASQDAAIEEKVKAPLAALGQAEANEMVLQTQLDEVLARAGQIGRQLADLAPDQRFYSFVAERATSGDYRRELSLVSTIRRDFELLIELMNDWKKPATGSIEGHENRQRIDRIVLYIDDLDRCSPKQVVDVLQAVHLLLALDLFVVIVGVDPRWLLHSLEQQYRDNFVAEPAGALPPGAAPAIGSAWNTSSLDYLEKIFNIPFVLPRMTGASFRQLVEALAQTRPQPPALIAPLVPDVDRTEREPAGDLSAAQPDDTSPFPPPPSVVAPEDDVDAGTSPSAAPRPTPPAPQPLSADERILLGALGALIGTPRQAKRLMNLYRTLRSSGGFATPAEFVGEPGGPGEYQAVVVLLGLLTADPELLGQFLWAPPNRLMSVPTGGICRRAEAGRWSDVVTALTPSERDGTWTNYLGVLSPADRDRWLEVGPQLAPTAELVTLPSLTAFRKWGPIVARFSFVLSPLATTS